MSRPPQILCLSPYVAHPATHGGGIRTRMLLAALHGLGDVHHGVPVTSADDQTNALYLAATEQLTLHALPARGHHTPGPWAKLERWLRGESELLARRWTAAARAQTSRLLDEHRFDLVVADASHVLPLLPNRPWPLLLHLHNIESAVLGRLAAEPGPLRTRLVRRIEVRQLARAETRALRAAIRTVTVSDPDRALALQLCPTAHVTTVPNAVELPAPMLPAPPASEPVRLLFVGRLDYPPNLEAVTELVEHHLPVLRAAWPGLGVRIVGADPAGAARALQRPGVECMGLVADVRAHYRGCHAAYVPLRNGGGTRLKILEAFAMGLPVASTAIGAEGLAARDGVHFCRFETPAEGVQALRTLLGDQRPRLVAAARALAEREHSWPAGVTRLRAVCADALAAAGASRARR